MALVPFPGPQAGALQRPPDDDDDDDLATGDGKMSLLEHLDELRKRIIRACLGVLVGILLGFLYINDIFNFVLQPTIRAMPAGRTLIYTRPGEAFSMYVTVSLITGAILASPFIMYQVWKFIAPGLYSNEKKFAIPFVLFTTIGFVLGAAFNHFIAFPFMMIFFASFNTQNVAFMPRLEDVFSLYSKMLLGLGDIFQMPAVVFFLAKMKMVTARFLVKQFKYAFLLFFIAAAVITPTGDPVNMTIFAAPMVVLYGMSILIAWIVGLTRAKSGPDQID
jgi:sec-independent protein translocase protein TatC